MIWEVSYRCDPQARALADRHYSRQTIGADGFVPPGRCYVLKAPGTYWVTSWPFAEYVKHAWAGAWMCSAFRNERQDLYLSSDIIRQAVAATRCVWSPPPLGMITFVDAKKTKRKRDPGRCFVKAGFKRLKERTKGGLVVLQMLPQDMPEPELAIGQSMRLIA